LTTGLRHSHSEVSPPIASLSWPMPRAPRIFDPVSPIHVSCRTNNREPFPLPLDEMWSILSVQFSYIVYVYNIKLHSVVLMPNHFHAIVTAPNMNFSKAIAFSLREVAKETNWKCGKINHLWGGRHFACQMQKINYQINCYKYVYQNPLRAKLCQFVEDYPYSTLPGLLGFERLTFPIEPDDLIAGDVGDTLKWLNTRISKENLLIMRRSLRRRVFKLPKVRGTGKQHKLETSRI